MKGMTVDQLVDEAVQVLGEYVVFHRVEILREVARLIVELRSRYTRADGRVDWGGRSTEYRECVGQLYTRAGLTDVDRNRVQTALRYHVGPLLRERATEAELAAAGILPEAAKVKRCGHRVPGYRGGRVTCSLLPDHEGECAPIRLREMIMSTPDKRTRTMCDRRVTTALMHARDDLQSAARDMSTLIASVQDVGEIGEMKNAGSIAVAAARVLAKLQGQIDLAAIIQAAIEHDELVPKEG